ncbi:MAG: hypothetical protein Q9M40_05740 [Sulfurimonas sp.]|nr:hypothetical protein [Sulfurimonas sp.]
MKEIQNSVNWKYCNLSHNAGTWEYKELVAGSSVYGLVFSNLADRYVDMRR